MKTVKQFIDTTNIPAKLVRATIRQAGGWDSFKEMAEDIANHGADAGWLGFIYYSETVAFAQRNRLDIVDYAYNMAYDMGESGAYSLIAGFNCFRGMDLTADSVADAVNNKNHEDHTQVMNALAWFALEEVARAYVDACEED